MIMNHLVSICVHQHYAWLPARCKKIEYRVIAAEVENVSIHAVKHLGISLCYILAGQVLSSLPCMIWVQAEDNTSALITTRSFITPERHCQKHVLYYSSELQMNLLGHLIPSLCLCSCYSATTSPSDITRTWHNDSWTLKPTQIRIHHASKLFTTIIRERISLINAVAYAWLSFYLRIKEH